jgi:uncharacterized membrane protein YdbT with pleckstrin-like domain
MTFVTIMTILTHFSTSSTNVSLNKVNNNKNLMSTAIPDDSGRHKQRVSCTNISVLIILIALFVVSDWLIYYFLMIIRFILCKRIVSVHCSH